MLKHVCRFIVIVMLLSFLSVSSTVSASGGYPVKVFFTPIIAANFDEVVPVDRVSPTLGVGAFAVDQLVVGPTIAERNRGLFSQLHNNINGPSVCTGLPNFRLSIASGKATIRFCRAISSAGVGDDARITTEISRTLLQFASIQKVVIITKSGDCFGDMSGQNMCLK